MKKLISIIASLSLAATMVAPVFAAELANNKPVVETTFVELTAEQFEQEWVGEPLETGYKAYLVDVNMTGLDLSNECAGKTNVLKKKRTGVLLMNAGYEIVFDSKANLGAVYTMDGLAGGHMDPQTVKAAFVPSKSTEGYPTIADGAAATTATEAFVYQFVITTKGTVTGTTKGEAKVTQFNSDAIVGEPATFYAEDLSYTVNGAKTNAITFGEPIPDPDPIVWTDRMDLEAGELKGAAWDVTIKEFDSTKTYVATFTNTANAADVKTLDMDLSYFEGEDGAEVGFVALLKLNKDRVVDLKVTEKE